MLASDLLVETVTRAVQMQNFYWRYVTLVVVLWRPAIVVVVVGVCNRFQMRTSKMYMFNFWS